MKAKKKKLQEESQVPACRHASQGGLRFRLKTKRQTVSDRGMRPFDREGKKKHRADSVAKNTKLVASSQNCYPASANQCHSLEGSLMGFIPY